MMRYWLYFILLFSLPLQAANQSLSPKTYEALSDIQTLLSEEKYIEAETEIKELEENLAPGFGLALTYQTHAQLFLAQENNDQALVYFTKALDLEAMKAVQAVSLATNVSQLFLSASKTDKAISALKPRILAAEKEKPESTTAMAFITLGSAYQVKGDFAASIPWLQKGIARSSDPRENWLQMLMAAHYQLKQYPQAIALLDKLIAINESKEEYWLQQAALFQLLNQPRRALEVLELAHVRGWLEKEDGLILLVQLLVTQGIPERGGRLLHNMLLQEKIELSEANWSLLASAWQQGRERLSAVMALEKAAQAALKNKEAEVDFKYIAAKLYYRAAQLLFDEGQYADAISDYQKALNLGIKDRKVGLALLMQGNSYFELEDYAKAKRLFSKALDEPSSSNSARAWLDYMQQLELFNT